MVEVSPLSQRSSSCVAKSGTHSKDVLCFKSGQSIYKIADSGVLDLVWVVEQVFRDDAPRFDDGLTDDSISFR